MNPPCLLFAAAKVTGFFIPAIVWEAFFSNVSYLLISSLNPLKITSPDLFLTANPLTQSRNERALLAAANVMAFLVLRNKMQRFFVIIFIKNQYHFVKQAVSLKVQLPATDHRR